MFDTGEVGAVGELLELVGKLADADVGLAGDDELMAMAEGLERARRALDAAQGHALAELEVRAVTEHDLGQSTGNWLAARMDLPAGACRARVRRSTKLAGRFAPLDAALAAGRVGAEHAKVILDAANPRIVEEFTELQELLVDAAEGCVFDRWRAEVRGIARLLDADGGYDPNADVHANRLTLTPAPDGTTQIRGQLVGDTAVVTRHALEALADELFRTHTRDAEIEPSLRVPDRCALRALALAEAARRASATDLDATRAPTPEATWVIHDTDPHQVRTDTWGEHLPTAATDVLDCCATIRGILADHWGNPIDLSDRVALITPQQRAALAARDGGCVFPGCDRPPAWCDGHHVKPRHRDGTSSLDNCALLCRHHHGITHRNGWNMRHAGHQRFTWTTPTGRTLHSQRHGRQPRRQQE